MGQYEKRILNDLLDFYENSLLSRKENKVAVHISFPFTQKTMPEYFDESSLAYEDIHACVTELVGRDFIAVNWKKGKENHILNRVLLKEESIGQIYQYIGRMPKRELENNIVKLLRELGEKYKTPVAAAFLRYLIERISCGKPASLSIWEAIITRSEQNCCIPSTSRCRGRDICILEISMWAVLEFMRICAEKPLLHSIHIIWGLKNW